MERPFLDHLYSRVADEEDARVCKDIPETACREVPGNFFKILFGKTVTAIGDHIASAKTTLPWLLNAAGAPAWMVGVLVPIREAGSMLPQLWLGGAIRGRPVRKVFWALACLGQASALGLIVLAALLLQGIAFGWVLIASLVFFALSRAVASITSKDVMGKTIPKTRRGLLGGWAALVGGGGALVVGLSLAAWFGDDAPLSSLLVLPLLGLVLWLLAAGVFFSIREEAGASEGGARVGAEVFSRLGLLRREPDFGRFVLARAFAMGSALAAPFYVVLAREQLGDAVRVLGVFIAMEGLAGVLAGPFLGRLADLSSRRLLQITSCVAGIASLILAGWSLVVPVGWWNWIVFPLMFLVLGVAHAGIRLGRKTYLVDMATGDRRTDFVAVSNTVMGAALLLVGGLLASVAAFSGAAALAVAGVMGLVGGFIARSLREVSG